MSSGKIDRSRATKRVDRALTNAVLARTRASWGALGPPRSWTFKGKRESGGTTVYVYRVTFARGQVWNMAMALTADGKLTGYVARP